jgi:hypothetical protein
MHSIKPAARDAQERPSSSLKKFREPISGHKERDQFICAVLACDGLTPLELKIAVRLGMFFNCTTGQCNPGYTKLAQALGIAPRSARRSVAALMAYGIVGGDQSAGGSHDQTRNFSLFMPPARVTAPTSPVKADKPDKGRGTKSTLTGDEQTPRRGTLRGPHNTEKENTENTEQRSALSARSVSVDRVVTEPKETTADDAAPRPANDTEITAALIPETKRDSADAGRLDRWAAFEKIKRAYPQGHVADDDENNFAAFEIALDVGNTVASLIESAKDTAAAAGEGDEIPELVEFLAQKCWTETQDPPALNARH